jgi:hypothetical protein
MPAQPVQIMNIGIPQNPAGNVKNSQLQQVQDADTEPKKPKQKLKKDRDKDKEKNPDGIPEMPK